MSSAPSCDAYQAKRSASDPWARSALDAIERKVAKIVRAIEDGAYHPTFKARLAELEKEKAVIKAKLAGTANTPVLRLHPNLSALYRSKVEKLADALRQPGTATEAGEILRSLIERIVLTPKGGTLHAELLAISLCSRGLRRTHQAKAKAPALMRSRGYCRWLRGEDLNL